MISLLSLWLPILLSAVAVFIVSSVIHMVLTYHRSNVSQLPDEDQFRNTVGPLAIPPGEYTIPHCSNPGDMKSDEYLQKLAQGPVACITVLPNQPFPMGKSLIQWFIYSILVGLFSAYLSIQSLSPGADYLEVMRIVATVAFLGYAFAFIQDSIWWFRKWSTTIKFMFDGLVYALLTGGIFGWLWPTV